MSLTVHFIANSRASCLYAADAVAQGRKLVDARLAAVLHQPAAALAARLNDARGPLSDAWHSLVPLVATCEMPADWLQVSLKGETGQVPQAADLDELAALVIRVEAAILAVYPQLAAELPLRSRPLIEQWEAYGPGLWRQLARFIAARRLAKEAIVLLVQPVCGGGGASYNPHNTVCFEAVLANPVPRLPEVLRLAWLLAQLGGDARRASPFEALALIPAVLAAAEQLELARCDDATIQLALANWLPEVSDFEATAAALAEWWREADPNKMDWTDRIRGLSARLASTFSLNYAP